MLYFHDIPYPDGSVFFSQMPERQREELLAEYLDGAHGLLKDTAPVQMTADVGYIMVFAGYKLKVDKRETGYHLVGL